MDRINYKKEFNDSFSQLIDLLKIASVYDEKTVSKEMPYGKSVYDAYQYMINLAKKDGFIVKEYDGQALSISYNQNDKDRIDIPCHLDVVAASAENFNIRVEDGKLIGRGTDDMKTCGFLCYLSLKLLRKRYPNIKKEIRLVFGCDEERTMEDMKYYIKKAGYPSFAFTPDGSFPIGIGEKGALMWTIEADYQGIIESCRCGRQCNIVPNIAVATLKNNQYHQQLVDYIKKNNIKGIVKGNDGKDTIEITGDAVHASKCFLGHSATMDLCKMLSDVIGDEICSNLYKCYSKSYGEGFDSFVSKEYKRCLTVNLGVLNIENGKLTGQVDCRYPYGTNSKDITNNLKRNTLTNVSLDYDDMPTECDDNDPYVLCMLKTYRKTTWDFSKPVVSGGVSYAKVFKHAVSYGPHLANKASTAHQDGEFVYIKDCYKWFKIYYRTIKNLALLEVE